MRPKVLNEARKKGCKLIMVEPGKTEYCSKADYWLKLRPNSDGALAMGMIKVIVEEDLWDKEYVERFTVGFDELKKEVATFTLEDVEEENVVIEQPMMELAVDEIVSAYETEGPEADVKFTNKILRVTGVISRIDVKEAQALFSLTLEAENSGPLRQSMRCIFSREHGNELQQLVKSQTVTVQGKYDGSIINISMRDCYLVQ